MIQFEDYKARIGFLKRISGYHFDPFREDEKPFRILGHFRGTDWMPEVKALESETDGGHNFGFDHCVQAGQKEHRPNPQFDLCATGEKNYGHDHVFLQRLKANELTRERAPIIYKMVDWFGLEPGTVVPRLHIQHPGQMFPVHVDGLMNHKNSNDTALRMKAKPQDWTRIQVQLEDWVWGNVWGVGNTFWAQWRAGEIMVSPWWIYPHYTANCGFAPRYSLQITGKVTDVTRERLKRENEDILL